MTAVLSPFASGGLSPWQFAVSAYGAKGDGTTDDTAAIKSALAAAYAYAIANNNYYELIFNSAIYLIGGATSTGTLGITGKCKAQIPLHVTATTNAKVTGVWRGTRDASALYHWQQTAVQQSGAVLKTTLDASAQYSVTGTEPSVVGGGIPANGYGGITSVFGNDLIVLDGVTIQTPNDPHICGFDFRGVAEANVINASVMVNAGGGLISAITLPTQAWQFGLAMPQTNNNDNCNVQVFSTEGQNYGIVASEHTVIWSLRACYCIAGLVASGGGTTTPHGMIVYYASCEAGASALNINYNEGGSPIKIVVKCLDVEAGGAPFGVFNYIQDPNNYGVGEVGMVNIGASTPRTATFAGTPVMNGGSGLRIRALDLPLGHITAPSVPASTTALLNGSGAEAAVTVTGGTVTVIAVDGTATGLTAGTVIVPSNKNIALTYSAAPTWNWVLF